MDLMKWYGKMGAIAMGFMTILMLSVSIAVAIGTGSITGFIIGLFLVFIVLFPTTIVLVPILILSAFLAHWMHFSSNKVKLGSRGIETITIRNRFYPAIRNTIPYEKIVKIEEGKDGYIQHIREKTPTWYYVLAVFHRIPHAGLYIPLTDPKNLLVLYLDEPVEITNNNMKNFLYRGLKIEKHPVTEVIIDIISDRHEEFVDMLDWRIRSQMNY